MAQIFRTVVDQFAIRCRLQSSVSIVLLIGAFASFADGAIAQDMPKDKRLQSAYTAIECGDYDSATTLLSELLKSNPRNVDVRRCVGVALYRQGRIGDALVNLQYCASSEQSSPSDWLLIGHGNFSQGKYLPAIESYSKVVQSDPKCTEAYESLANCYEALGAPQHAVAVRTRAKQHGCKMSEEVRRSIHAGSNSQAKG